MVDIEIRYFDGCPNWQVAYASIGRLVEEIGLETDVTLTVVGTPEKAEALSFRGSPTILIDGTDPWDDPDAPVGLSCRVYRTESGFAGTPTEAQLEEALRTRG